MLGVGLHFLRSQGPSALTDDLLPETAVSA